MNLAKQKTQNTLTRKQRTIKNGYVDIDNVNESPGDNYCEWIKICKSKLILRENNLINIRIGQTELIINEEIESYRTSNLTRIQMNQITYTIPQHILKPCFETISGTINAWQGVDFSKRTSVKSYKIFRKYFNASKNWWDLKKSNILGKFLWSSILNNIQIFVFTEKQLLNNKQILYKILSGLFNAKIKFENTKIQPLIPNGIIKNCDELHIFLYKINNLLNIGRWLRNQIATEKKSKSDKHSKKNRTTTGSAKTIAEKLRNTLNKFANDGEEASSNRSTNNNAQILYGQKRFELSNNNVVININYDKIIFDLADQFIENMSKCQTNINRLNLPVGNHHFNSMNSETHYYGYHMRPMYLQTMNHRYNPLQGINYYNNVYKNNL